MKSKRTTGRLDVIESLERIIGSDQKLQNLLAEKIIYAKMAVAAYRARTAAGLTQSQLAKRIGARQSAIARLEDADYGPRSLALLEKIAAALNCRIRLRLLPKKRRSRAA